MGPGGGDLGEFTLGKRRGLLGECSRPPQVACAHGPSVGKSAQWAGSPVGLAPPNRPTEQQVLHIWRGAVSKDLLTSDFEQCFRLLAALGILLGRPCVAPGLFFVEIGLRRYERPVKYVVYWQHAFRNHGLAVFSLRKCSQTVVLSASGPENLVFLQDKKCIRGAKVAPGGLQQGPREAPGQPRRAPEGTPGGSRAAQGDKIRSTIVLAPLKAGNLVQRMCF